MSASSSVAVGSNEAAPAVNKWAVAVAVAAGALLEVIDTSIVNVALADIQAAVGATLAQVSWVISSYAIANVIVLPMSAWLGQRFGKKRYFVFSLIGFTLASVLCGLATNLTMLIAARALQGLMGGGLLAKAQAFLFETFPREEQAIAQGFFGAIVIAGPVIGPTLGGFITTHSDWRYIFFINVPVGIAAVLLCLQALPADSLKRAAGRVDFFAIGLLAIGLGSMQAVLEEGNSEDWFDSPLIITLSVAAVVGLVMFVFRELKSEQPVVDLRVLRYRSLWAGSLLSIIIGIALYGALFAVPIFAQTILGYTSEQTGLLLLPGAITSAVTMIFAARLVRMFDPRYVLVVGGLTLALSLSQLGHLTVSTGESQLFWPMIIRAIGTVLMFLPLNLSTIGPIPKQDVSAATGFFNLTRQLGGSIGVAMLSGILDHRMAFHRATLVEHMTTTDPRVFERVATLERMFTSHGYVASEAHVRALAMLDGTLQRQASVLSFNDTFWVTAMLVVSFLPLVFLLGKPPRGANVAGAH
ncbi:MAG TPA: DHA2 family efflux MFS transporter permease subunit [Polyangiales bacterium]|nr:DHA2 family efflux MFS transporter permease subunit [Polyangiales bacterium]